MANWTDAKTLFFHFATTNGLAASLPMTRVLHAFAYEFKGVPGTKEVMHQGKKTWLVPGYRCPNCGKTFFGPDEESLKHGCMNGGGIVSASPSMGAA